MVQAHHGIGRFVERLRRPVDGVEKDYIKIAYAGSDCLYVPATSLDLVSKYIGAGGEDSDRPAKLNKLGGENGIGILDIVENRLVGMKDRGVYETPGGTILYYAHEVLEMITLDKDTLHEKQKLAVDFADLVYNGKWFTPLREALSAFVDKTQEHVTGTVKIKLYKGNVTHAGVTSPETLYSEELATFNESDYDQMDSQGFINLWGLPDKVQALREQGKL